MAGLLDVLYNSGETLNSACFWPFKKFVSAFHPLYTRDNHKVIIMCSLTLNSFVRWLPVFLFFLFPVPSKHVCTDHTILMQHKDKAKTFSLHVNTGADTNQGTHTTSNRRRKSLPCPFIKALGETWCKSESDEPQECAIQHKDTQIHHHTQTHIFLPRVVTD